MKKTLTFTFADGAAHQAGASFQVGNILIISECVKTSKTFAKDEVIITDIKVSEASIDAAWAYGVVSRALSSGSTEVGTCVLSGHEIELETQTGIGYPVLFITGTLKNT